MDLAGKVGAGARRMAAWTGAKWRAGVACALAACALVALAWRLWPEWVRNPDISHGFFMLPIVVMLWLRAREDAGRAKGLSQRWQWALALPLSVGLLGASLLGTIYAVALGWSGVPALFLLAGAGACAALLAATLAAGRDVRWIAFGWPVLVLAAVVVLSAPLPPATAARLTVSLREFVTSGVVETLRIFGIPALQSGNVIHLGATSVGVEDACSGVRSLISCVLAGLVLSALMLRSPWRRFALVALAGPLALMMNFFRSLALTLLARSGVDIMGAWHDWLGFAVLGVTTALLAWMASALEEAPLPEARAAAASARESAGWSRAAVAGAALASLVVAASWVGYVVVRTQAPVSRSEPAPDYAAMVPAVVGHPGWRVETRPDLQIFASTLRTTHLVERSYLKRRENGPDLRVTVYVAWWAAGASSVSEVGTHTPDVCWPGAGWVLEPARSARVSLPVGAGRADEAEQRIFVREGGALERVWYWHLVDKEPLRPFNPLRFSEQLGLFFEHGVRREAPQAFVRISSNEDWERVAAEPLVREILANLSGLGLPLREDGAGEPIVR